MNTKTVKDLKLAVAYLLKVREEEILIEREDKWFDSQKLKCEKELQMLREMLFKLEK